MFSYSIWQKHVGNSSSSCLKKKCHERSQDKKVQQEMVNKQHVDVLGLTVEEVRGQKRSYLRLLYQQLHMPPFGQSKTHAKLPQTILFSANFLKMYFPKRYGFLRDRCSIKAWLQTQRALPGICSCKSSTFNPGTFKGTPNCLFKSALAFETLSPAVNFGLLSTATLPSSSLNRPASVSLHTLRWTPGSRWLTLWTSAFWKHLGGFPHLPSSSPTS